MNLKKLLKNLKLSEQTISMVLGALVVLVMGVLIFNYVKGTNQPASEQVTNQPKTTESNGVEIVEENGKQFPVNLPENHKVEAGQNLWTIAEKYYGSGYNWVDIASENGLADANQISSGQELKLPRVEIKKPAFAQEAPTATPTTTITETEQPQAGDGLIEGGQYTIVRGDNLWKIAVRAYGDGYRWTEIAKVNNLSNPNLIYAGNTLTLPR